MKKVFLPLTVLGCLLFSTGTPGAAGNERLNWLLDKIQKSYNQTQAYSAEFEQHTGSANARVPKIAKGKVSFAKPGKMRWDYSEPEKAFITNGTTFWMVQPDRHEVLEMPAERAFGNRTPMSFLTGVGNLRKEFTAALQKEEKGFATLRLDLKEPTTQAQYLIMEVDTATGLARSVKTVDFFGAYNTILFRQYKLDEKFAKDYFTYQARPGFTVVHPQEALPGTYEKSK